MAANSEKKCALMRQTWYEAAKKRMKDASRLAFYEMCFDFEFYGDEPKDQELFSFDDALLMFDMVREDLRRDMEKAENIAMRNRRNGMLGGRPVGSSKSTNPKKPKGNPEKPSGSIGFTTTLHNTLHNTTQHISSAPARKRRHKDIETYERFCVMFVFFYSGATDFVAETDRFYNYYTARDWQVGKGMKVKDRVALAKAWDIKDSNPALIQVRQRYSEFIQAADPDELELLTSFRGMGIYEERKVIELRLADLRAEQIIEERYLKAFSHMVFEVWKLEGYNLEYSIRE